MPFQPATTSLPDRTSLRTFLDTSDGVIYHSNSVNSYILLQNSALIAKNTSFNFLSDRDLAIVGAYANLSSSANSARVTYDLYDVSNVRLFTRTINFTVGDGFVYPPGLLIFPRAHRLTITSSEAIDKFTAIAQEIFTKIVKI
jgi:hypothetical protein